MSRSRPIAGLLTASLLLALLPAGVAARSPDPGPAGVEWQLARIAGSGVPFIDVPAGVIATLVIDGTSAGGSGGCNSWFADVAVDGERISFGQVGSTMMACEEPRMSIESAYLGFLPQVATWRTADGGLELLDASGTVLLAFEAPGGTPLEGIEWLLREARHDGALTAIPAPVTATLLLDAGSASGSSGCNRFFGGYVLDGQSLTFGQLGGTEMACPEPQMSVEAAYLADLALVASWAADADGLRLLDAEGNVVLVFGSAPSATVVGGWTVNELNNGHGGVVLLGPTAAYAEFLQDGSVSGSTGCNRFFGSYTVDGDTIAIGPLGTTRMACADPAAMELESQFLAAMAAAHSWATTVEGWLELRDAGGALQVGFAPGVPAA